MDYSEDVSWFAAAVLVCGFFFRNKLRAWFRRRRKSAVKSVAQAEIIPPVPLDLVALTNRLYELDKIFGPFGSNAAHPSDLYSQTDFREAVRLLALPDVPFATVLQFVEGNSWSLSSAALAALKKRSERNEAVEPVLKQCVHFSPWAMYFALDFLFDAEPRAAIGAPFAYARDWWIDNRWMPNIFRDYLARCAERGDAVTFGNSLWSAGTSPNQLIRRFLQAIAHPSAASLIKEIDDAVLPAQSAPPAENVATLKAVGRFWKDQKGVEILVMPDAWDKAFAVALAALRQNPPRSMLISGEPMVGKTSFLRLLAQRIEADGWTVFEASGADLQADQIYIGQLEGRIRQVVDELAKGHRMIWYIPDIVQLALSGTHSGQSATMLDQIMPAISAGRLVVWAEATPKGIARLVRLKPLLRGLFETVAIEPLSPAETLALAHDVIDDMADRAEIHFDADCADVALDTAGQYLGGGTLPGSVLLLLKLTAVRSEPANGPLTPRAVLETLSQISGLPRVDPRHQGTARSQSHPRFLRRARARPARGGRRRRGPHRHAQSRTERSGQTDRRLFVRRPDRHRKDRACQSGIANFCSARSSA